MDRPIDKGLMIFSASVLQIARKFYKAGMDGKAAEPLRIKIYNEYLKEGGEEPNMDWINRTPRNVSNWIKERLKKYFHYMDEPPKWIDEPDWRFLNGIPMTFVGQLELRDSKFGEDAFMSNGMLYIFSGKDHTGGDCKIVFKMVRQDRGIPGSEFIN